MITRVSDVIRGWLGWCPNHRVTVAPPVKIGRGIYIIAIICILAIPAAALLMLSPPSQNVAVWAFQVDNTGLKHFVARLPATEDTTGKLTFSTALPSGTYWLVIEHPGKDGSFPLGLDGENVKMQSPNSGDNSMMLFTISGPGSLQGEDAYQALMAAFKMSDQSGNAVDVTEREYTV